MQKILWMDNDSVFLGPHIMRLEDAGYKVVQAYHVAEAEELLRKDKPWGLVIIDPMMNVSEEEEKEYPPSETDGGLKAGLVFLNRNNELLKQIGARAVVFTMRDDQEIIDDFTNLGITKEAIKNKLDASDTAEFVKWIEDMMRERK